MPRAPAGRRATMRHNFAALLRQCVASRGGEAAFLSRLRRAGVRLKAKTFSEYLRGVRLAGGRPFKKIVELLNPSPDEARALQSAYAAANATAKRQSLAAMPAGDTPEAFFLRDPYAPFSGEPGRFVDDLMTRAFAFAGIALKPAPLGGRGQAPFDLLDRLDRIERGDVHLLVNLITLSRLRKLAFFEIPIRVSLNGVALRQADADALEWARALLGGFPLTADGPDVAPFELLAIVNEVGQLHILRRIELATVDNGAASLPRPCENVETLDHKRLATALEEVQSKHAKAVILFSDEVTALGVLRALEGKGQLLYPLCTEMSVAASRERRHLPAHTLGIGYRRPHGSDEDRRIDADDGALFDGVLTGFLGLEPETIAADYQRLYDRLVEYAAKSLQHNPDLYVGGIRKLGARTIASRDLSYHVCLIDQSARSFARWCLRVSQRAADGYSELDPWTPVLRRARQRIILSEARRRNAIRDALKLMLSLAAGGSERQAIPSRHQFQQALSRHQRQLAYLVEREFDIRIPRSARFFGEHADGSFEVFLSAFQRELEIVSGEPDAMVVKPLTEREARADALVRLYDSQLRGEPKGSAARRRYDARSAVKGLKAFSVRNLGETVAIGWMRESAPLLELVDICVAEHMRGSRANQLLLRHAVDYADKHDLDAVVITSSSVPTERNTWFHQMGFLPDAAGHLRYELLTLT